MPPMSLRPLESSKRPFSVPDSPVLIPFHRHDGLRNVKRCFKRLVSGVYSVNVYSSAAKLRTGWNSVRSAMKMKGEEVNMIDGEVNMDLISHDGALWTHGYKAYNWGNNNDSSFDMSTPRIASDLNEVRYIVQGSFISSVAGELSTGPRERWQHYAR